MTLTLTDDYFHNFIHLTMPCLVPAPFFGAGSDTMVWCRACLAPVALLAQGAAPVLPTRRNTRLSQKGCDDDSDDDQGIAEELDWTGWPPMDASGAPTDGPTAMD